MKRVPRHTTQIDEPPQWGKTSLKFVMHRCSDEAKFGDVKELLFIILINSHKGGFNKPFKNKITCNDYRVDTTNIPAPINSANIISNSLSPFFAAVSTAPTPPRESRSQSRKSHSKRGS